MPARKKKLASVQVEEPVFTAQMLAAIRELRAARQPLNITAVKRHSPKLLAEIYSVPGRGWREALQAVGIRYADFEPEILSTCQCRLCNKEYAILTGHLRASHSLTVEEYRKDFPGEEVMAETIRSARMGVCKVLAHWEPVWSPEYCLDRIREHARQGRNLNSIAMANADRGLHGLSLHYFGCWDEALRRSGFTPEKIRIYAPAMPMDKAQIIAALKERRRRNQRLNVTTLEEEDPPLIKSAVRQFGSYNSALCAAGIKPRSVWCRRYIYRESEKQRFLAQARKVGALKGKARWKAARKLHRQYGLMVPPCFKNWGRVAQKAGVEEGRLGKTRFCYKEAIKEWLDDWLKQGKPLNRTTVLREDKGLYEAIARQFGSFEAMEKALFKKAILPAAVRR
jgi:hypothetical protein